MRHREILEQTSPQQLSHSRFFMLTRNEYRTTIPWMDERITLYNRQIHRNKSDE